MKPRPSCGFFSSAPESRYILHFNPAHHFRSAFGFDNCRIQYQTNRYIILSRYCLLTTIWEGDRQYAAVHGVNGAAIRSARIGIRGVFNSGCDDFSYHDRAVCNGKYLYIMKTAIMAA